jgi:hypothetical protein
MPLRFSTSSASISGIVADRTAAVLHQGMARNWRDLEAAPQRPKLPDGQS